MNLTENTKVRIKVPKHLYEAIQAELDKKHGMEEAESQTASLEEIAAAMDKALAFAKKLGKQIADKKDGSLTQKDQSRLVDNFRSKVREFSPLKPQMDESYEDTMEEGEEMKEYVGMSPDQMQIVDILGQLIAGGALGGAVLMAAKTLYSFLKNKKSAKVSTEESAIEEIEEAFDFETLMEAMKDASKKKAEDKKKMTEAEAKKKVEDEKKKKEAEAKKKAAAAKKK